jgi:hypothetical protein
MLSASTRHSQQPTFPWPPPTRARAQALRTGDDELLEFPYRPEKHWYCTPVKQYVPGPHMATPVRLLTDPFTGVEYPPSGTALGDPLLNGQYLSAEPQGNAVGDSVPTGQ